MFGYLDELNYLRGPEQSHFPLVEQRRRGRRHDLGHTIRTSGAWRRSFDCTSGMDARVFAMATPSVRRSMDLVPCSVPPPWAQVCATWAVADDRSEESLRPGRVGELDGIFRRKLVLADRGRSEQEDGTRQDVDANEKRHRSDAGRDKK